MQRSSLALLIVLLLVSLAGPAHSGAPSKNEKNAEREAAKLDKTASTQKGEQAVRKRIEKDFHVTAAQVTALKEKNLGYGEIVIVLTLVRHMQGGLTEENIGQVLALHTGPPAAGWDDVARRLRVKLGAIVSQVKKVNNEAHRAMKQAQAKPAAAPQQPAAETPPQRPGQKKSYPGEGKALPKGRAAD